MEITKSQLNHIRTWVNNVNVAGNISKPSTASINKYNLKYDRESKQWV